MGMADALVFDMPVALGLDTTIVDLESPNARDVVNGGVLEPPCGLPGFTLEGEECDIHLDMMARHLLVVAPGMNLPDARTALQCF